MTSDTASTANPIAQTAVEAVADKGKTKAKAGSPLPFLDQLWAAADKLRGQLEEGEYKHIVLGLVFLKYVSDAFEQRRAAIAAEVADPDSDFYLKHESDRVDAVEDRLAYTSKAVAWIPEDARWEKLQAHAKSADVGRKIDQAMEMIERENPSLRGVLPKTFARAEIKPRLLGELVDVFSNVEMMAGEDSNEDLLGRVYEYFLNKFGTNEGGQYYTPQGVVRLLVEMLEPYKGRVFDPACGSGGMFVQSVKFLDEHGGRRGELSVFGQEAVASTWRLAKMNLAIRHIEADLGDSAADSFHEDKHPDLRADFVIANPPFNMSVWGGERLRIDKRWTYGAPPVGNANYAWVQHFLWHLAPSGTAGFVLANGALSVQGAEGEIRRTLVENDLVDCIVGLPPNLFFGTPISVSLWFLTRNKKGHAGKRTGSTLFIDAQHLGSMVSRVQRVLNEDDIALIADTYKTWKAGQGYADIAGFARTATQEEIKRNRGVLSPSSYVGVADRPEMNIEALADEVARFEGVLRDNEARAKAAADAVVARLAAIQWLTPDTSSWRPTRLGDAAEIIGGGTPSTRDPSNFGGDIAWITPKDLSGYRRRYIARGERTITQKGLDSSSARLLPKDAVLLSSRAPIGLVAMAQKPLATNQGFRSLVARDGYDPRFLYYLLLANRALLESRGNGTTFREISGSALKVTVLPMPPLAEQKAIADVLTAIDDLIEANADQNEALAELRSSLGPVLVSGQAKAIDG